VTAGGLESSVSDERDRRERHPLGIRHPAISVEGRSREAPPLLSTHNRMHNPSGSGNAYSRDFVRDVARRSLSQTLCC
jgi:hypothetical protein